jgi:capsular polysaccharide export protein
MLGRVLLLQGPMGPFFNRLATELMDEGHRVFKINFNAGDAADYPHPDAYAYTGSPNNWAEYLAEFLVTRRIDRIFLFGDCRTHHSIACDVAEVLGVAIFVFEEGYVRPHYITMERGGVNGRSAVPRTSEAFRGCRGLPLDAPAPVPPAFGAISWYSTRYAINSWLRRREFPRYRHHRALNPYVEAVRWAWSGCKKLYYKLVDWPLRRRLETELRGRFFLVPLQVHCDAQIVHHSSYSSIEAFISEAIVSFARHAPREAVLLFKHHPLDRAYCHYGRVIADRATAAGVKGRVFYIHEAHLPTLFRDTRGTLTINSTVGLSSLHHKRPVKVMGDAVYDIPGLTCQGSLAEFWNAPGQVDRELYLGFRRYLLGSVLANGNFYRRVRTDLGATGVAWPGGSISAASRPVPEAVPAGYNSTRRREEEPVSDVVGSDAANVA